MKNLLNKTLFEDSCNGDIIGSPYDCERSLKGVFLLRGLQWLA
jgi:hypothetical protein